jgi:hypothetical protein
MKKLFLMLIAGIALVMAHDFHGVLAGDHDGDGGNGIPLSKLAGKFSTTSQGSATVCFGLSGTESCSTPGAAPVVFTGPFAGQFTEDKDGNACGMVAQATSIPGDVHPPTVTMPHFTFKITNYDSATASGDDTFSFYTGGTCKGSKFDSTGATVSTTGSAHLVASDHGQRVDVVVTNITDSVGDIGAFNLTAVELRQ